VAFRIPLPSVKDVVHVANDLDNNLRKYRAVELERIAVDAEKLRSSSTDVDAALVDIEGFKSLLTNLCIEVERDILGCRISLNIVL